MVKGQLWDNYFSLQIQARCEWNFQAMSAMFIKFTGRHENVRWSTALLPQGCWSNFLRFGLRKLKWMEKKLGPNPLYSSFKVDGFCREHDLRNLIWMWQLCKTNRRTIKHDSMPFNEIIRCQQSAYWLFPSGSPNKWNHKIIYIYTHISIWNTPIYIYIHIHIWNISVNLEQKALASETPLNMSWGDRRSLAHVLSGDILW